MVMEKAHVKVRQALNGKEKVNLIEISEQGYSLWRSGCRHPPLAQLVQRECRERCEIAGYKVSEKTRVIVNQWAIGRDPRNLAREN
ncbi:Cytochrome P450 [Cinnamomum micranthum f. kanehirae]|uniref:Cytochrome P450 n=1 Tax=Cinnamomum micranthum f. kanehirae TaxID=337451 RepID=A0A3S3NRZ9_9MAGN|nr:Cytochrome P450 [Cinnamomum micranthum f. kanehirae]